MKILSKKVPALVDDEIHAQLCAHSWNGGNGRSGRYYSTVIGGRTVLLHRYIYELRHGPIQDGLEIDHIDQDPRNNTSANLRAVTRSVNHANRGKQANNTSGFKGVHRYKAYGCWMAKIKKEGRSIFLGYHQDAAAAAKAVNAAYAKLFPQVQAPNKI